MDEQDNNSAIVVDTTLVLVVEDEPAAREASCLYLRHLGYRVIAAANADDAISKGDEHRPDIVVSDWRLGGSKDGVDVARALQDRTGAQVVFVTAHPLEELRAATKDLDIVGYLRKPVSLQELADVIETAIAA